MQIENSQKSYGRIYRLTDKTNNKMYHGQTAEKDINVRWNTYRNIKCKKQPKLYRALKAHGPENFLFEIIDTSPQDQSQLDNLEIYYIAKFDSMNNGYNCDPGGRGTGHRSEETKRKISESMSGKNNPMFGKYHSIESKAKMILLNSGNNNPMFGKTHSEETKSKLSQLHKGKPKSEESKTKMKEAWKYRIRQPHNINISKAKIGLKRQYLPNGSYKMIKP